MAYKIGIVGLGVTGSNLALNMKRNGFPVAGYDLDPAITHAFAEASGKGKNLVGVDSPAALMQCLDRPRRILIMVPAIPTINAAVESRILSALKPEGVRASKVLHGPTPDYSAPRRHCENLACGLVKELGKENGRHRHD